MVQGVGSIDYDEIKNSLQEVAIRGEDWNANRSATLDTHGFRQFRIDVSGMFVAPTNLQLVAVSVYDPSVINVSWIPLPAPINIASFSPPTDSGSTLSTDVTERYSDYRFWKVQFDQDVKSTTLSYLGKKGEGIRPSVEKALSTTDLTVNELNSGIVDVVKTVQSTGELKSGTIDVVKRPRSLISGGIASGYLLTGVNEIPGTIDVGVFDGFSVGIHTTGTIVTNHSLKMNTVWFMAGSDTIAGSGTLVTTIKHKASKYRPIISKQDASGTVTVDIEYAGN